MHQTLHGGWDALWCMDRGTDPSVLAAARWGEALRDSIPIRCADRSITQRSART